MYIELNSRSNYALEQHLVSVIIPCFNQGHFIDDAVESVLDQTYRNFEIIIINDGSTDEYTKNKLKNYDKPNCRVIHTENRGLAGARNVGLRDAKGDYIQFLDADDVIDKNKFLKQLNLLAGSSHNSLSYCDYFTSVETDLSIQYPSRYLTPVFKTENYLQELINDWQTRLTIPCHSFLFKSSIFKEHDILFDESLPNHEDWECWMNIFALKPEVHYINEKLATYRIRDKAMSTDNSLMNKGYLKAILKQKYKHRQNVILFRLLSLRYNQIKFGFPSRYAIVALVRGFFLRVIRKLIKIAGS